MVTCLNSLYDSIVLLGWSLNSCPCIQSPVRFVLCLLPLPLSLPLHIIIQTSSTHSHPFSQFSHYILISLVQLHCSSVRIYPPFPQARFMPFKKFISKITFFSKYFLTHTLACQIRHFISMLSNRNITAMIIKGDDKWLSYQPPLLQGREFFENREFLHVLYPA